MADFTFTLNDDTLDQDLPDFCEANGFDGDLTDSDAMGNYLLDSVIQFIFQKIEVTRKARIDSQGQVDLQTQMSKTTITKGVLQPMPPIKLPPTGLQ